MKYQFTRNQVLKSDDRPIQIAAEALYPLFYPNQSRVTPLVARSTGSQSFYKSIVSRILDESGLMCGEVDHFAVAAAIHEVSCPNESRVTTFHDLSEWRQGVYLGWAQRLIDSVIGDHYDA